MALKRRSPALGALPSEPGTLPAGRRRGLLQATPHSPRGQGRSSYTSLCCWVLHQSCRGDPGEFLHLQAVRSTGLEGTSPPPLGLPISMLSRAGLELARSLSVFACRFLSTFALHLPCLLPWCRGLGARAALLSNTLGDSQGHSSSVLSFSLHRLCRRWAPSFYLPEPTWPCQLHLWYTGWAGGALQGRLSVQAWVIKLAFKVACECSQCCASGGCRCVARDLPTEPPGELCLFFSLPHRNLGSRFVLEPAVGHFLPLHLEQEMSQERRWHLHLGSALDFRISLIWCCCRKPQDRSGGASAGRW